jgi:hypothetical protein
MDNVQNCDSYVIALFRVCRLRQIYGASELHFDNSLISQYFSLYFHFSSNSRGSLEVPERHTSVPPR